MCVVRFIRERKHILFVIITAVFLSTVMLDMSSMHLNGRIIQLLRYSAYGLILVKLVCDKYSLRQILLYVAGCILVGTGFLVNHNRVMVLYSLVFMAGIAIGDQLILKTYCIVHGIMLAILVTASQFDLVQDYIYLSLDPFRIRHYLGFEYTTDASFLFFFFALEYVCLRKGRLRIWEYLVGVAASVWLFWMTDTTMALLTSVGILMFFLLAGQFMEKGRITGRIPHLMAALPWILAVGSIAAQWLYDPENALFVRINGIVHDRLKLGNWAIERYGFHLFGSPIEWIGSSYQDTAAQDYNYVDCSYLQVALQQGILFLILVLVLYSYAIFRSIKTGKYYLTWAIVFVLLLSVTEPRLVNPVFNPFLMLAFCRMDESTEGVENIPA